MNTDWLSIDKWLNKIAEANTFGYKLTANGTRLFGAVPHVAPSAWFHSVYPGVTEEQLEEIENEIPIPNAYKEFLQACNGLDLFSGSLSLYGFRTNYTRTVEEVESQPFDLIALNTYEVPDDAKSSYFFIGAYKWDGSLLYIDSDDNKVYRCEAETSKPKNEWLNLDTMLKSEVARLGKLFDEKGREIDESASTVPETAL